MISQMLQERYGCSKDGAITELYSILALDLRIMTTRKDDFMKINEEDLMCAITLAETIIKGQKEYIKELEQKVEDLQKALDVVLQNKCRARKVKVKYIGRTQDVRKNNNR